MTCLPASLKMSQIARPFRKEEFTAISRFERWSRLTNSKIPCLPGFLPVIKDDQATAVIWGTVVSRLAREPWAIRLAMFGRWPLSINGSSTLNEAPSSPMTSSLLRIHSVEPRYDYTLCSLFVQLHDGVKGNKRQSAAAKRSGIACPAKDQDRQCLEVGRRIVLTAKNMPATPLAS